MPIDTQQELEEFRIWLKSGIDRGWCSDVVCNTHEGPPMTDEEVDAWDEGWDPCIFIMRIWES